MTVATRKEFTQAIHVRRNDQGMYEFATTKSKSFDATITYENLSFDWYIVEPLTGWGQWTHVICVTFGDQGCYHFVR